MNNPLILKEFKKQVQIKFNVYNSLFLNLPFRGINNIGILIPILCNVCKAGLENGKDPIEIIDSFFNIHTNLESEQEKIDFMFRVIQYVERQVVLFDSVEDAAFAALQAIDDNLSLKDYIHSADNMRNDAAIWEKLSSFSTRIVFTAHPTQFYTPSVLNIIANLKLLILKNDINGIDIMLRQLGLTSLINFKKPTPFDEAKNIIFFLSNVYYDAVTELYSNIKKNIHHSNFDNPQILTFGFWPGGDRDGNPYVNAEITNSVADELRMNLMKCYFRDVENLMDKLTFRGVEDIIVNLKNMLYQSMFDAAITINYEEIITPLFQIRDALVNSYSGLYIDELENLIDKVKIFKTHFASLDIRQNHSVHLQTVEAILKKANLIANSLGDLTKDELIEILLQKEIHAESNDFDDERVRDTIRTISMIKTIQRKNGEEGCNRYIISNSEDIYSVLFVFALLRWCCWKNDDIPVDIIPLFESMDGMSNSAGIMQELFAITEYREYISKRFNIQTVMLGFSDGTKDGGYFQANWAIYKTKENLSAICNQYGIKAIFFDGRGGPPARGGGKTHHFYASQSNRIANNAIQLTIQGQTITSKYGTKERFINNCEQLITAGLAHSLSGKENIISDESRQIIEKLALISYEKYKSLKHHPMFIPYLENKSTLKYYSEANIGSRPSKRGNKEKLELNDLRAISFVGSWSQLKQNVPGYYGVGTALYALVNEGKLEELKKLFNDVPFFKALILNSMMSLSKCYFELTAYIAKDEKYTEFWNMLYEEYKLSKQMTLLISQYSMLMAEEPISRSSIEIREQIVLPLLVIQQYALQKIEQNTPDKNNYEKIVKRSLYGNINASRNSA